MAGLQGSEPYMILGFIFVYMDIHNCINSDALYKAGYVIGYVKHQHGHAPDKLHKYIQRSWSNFEKQKAQYIPGLRPSSIYRHMWQQLWTVVVTTQSLI